MSSHKRSEQSEPSRSSDTATGWYRISNSLIAFLGALAAAIVPVTGFVQGYWENKLKEQDLAFQNQLKDKELSHQITMDFLNRALDSKLDPSDRVRVLEVPVNLPDNPLNKWAKGEFDKIQATIQQNRTYVLRFEAQYSRNLNEWQTASAECDLSQVRVDNAVSNQQDFLSLLKEARDVCAKANQLADALGETGAKLQEAKGQYGIASVGIQQKPQESYSSLSQVSLQIVSKMFPSTPSRNVSVNLPFVLEALREQGLTGKTIVLVALALIRADCEGFEPASEAVSRFNTSPGGHPFDLYDHRKDLGNIGPPDGSNFRGRGYIQITGRANYTKYSGLLGLGNQLVDNPELANDPAVSARILAAFLKDRQVPIEAAAQQDDLVAVLRLANGGSGGLWKFRDAFQIGTTLINERENEEKAHFCRFFSFEIIRRFVPSASRVISEPALSAADRLLMRDPGFYRRYFAGLRVLDPSA